MFVDQELCFVNFAASAQSGPHCKEDEFQCHHVMDGCIPYSASCDGWVDCMRDGSDEAEEECNAGQMKTPSLCPICFVF